MAEPETNIEIEDVLSSIRRLVSQDAGLPRAARVPHRGAAAAAEDANCLVLTPAQRVEEEEAARAAAEAAQAAMAPMSATAEMPQAPSAAQDPVPVAPEAEADIDLEVAVTPAVAPEVDDAQMWVDAEPEDLAEEDLPETAALSETEALLKDAETALAEVGAVLSDAEAALDDVGLEPGETLNEEVFPGNLGDELARLESTIAEMEAAVAESDVEFEPEEGHPFEADGAPPLVELPESYDAGDFAEAAEIEADIEMEIEAEADPVSMAERFPDDASEIGEAELLDAEEAGMGAVDPDLEDAAWDGRGEGMEWAEATLNLASNAGPRRLNLADADAADGLSDALQSSYDAMREEFEQDLERDDAATAPFDESVLDEEMLRTMVAQMIREELSGTLGERITRNVRKLVRREIQRALMGQDFE